MPKCRPSRLSRHGLGCLAIAVAIASGCVAPPARPLGADGMVEGRVHTDAWGNVSISVNGRTFRLSTQDLKPVGDVAIQAGSKVYNTQDGRFALPEGALRDIRDNSRAFFRVFVSGYVPKQVWIGQAGDDVVLAPQQVLAVSMDLGPRGGELRAKDGSVGITMPPGVLPKPGTRAALSTYVPGVTEETQKEAAKTRDEFMAKLKAKGAGLYTLTQTAGCEAPDDPLPCPPIAESMGVMLTVDGPLTAGHMTASIDLNVMLRGWDGNGQPPWIAHPGEWTDAQIAQAKAADKIMRTFTRIRGHGNRKRYEELLSEYGVKLEGTRLVFDVQVGVDNTIDGYIRTDVEAVSLLGVNLEFTAVSSVNGGTNLPPSALPPALAPQAGTLVNQPVNAAAASGLGLAATHLIGMDGGSLIGLDSASLIGLDSASLIGLDSASLIGLDGGNLIGLDSASLIGQDGGSLIGMDGGSLIGQDGGSLIGNDGGSLAGNVQVPLISGAGGGFSAPKYQLNAYAEGPATYSKARARCVALDGTPLTEWADIADNGDYAFRKLPKTPLFFFVEAEVGKQHLKAIAIAPGPNKKCSWARLDAATTVVADAARDRAEAGLLKMEQIFLFRYNDLVKEAKAKLTQADALKAVDKASFSLPFIPAVLDAVGTLLAGALGLDISLLPVPLDVTPPLGTGLFDVGSGIPAPTYAAGDDTKQVVWMTGGNPTSKEVWSIDKLGNANRVLDGSQIPSSAQSWAMPHYTGLFPVGNDLYIGERNNHALLRLQGGTFEFIRRLEFPAPDLRGVDPGGLTRTADGTFWFTSPGFDMVGFCKATGNCTFIGDPANGPTPFNYPEGIALSPDGTQVFIADSGNHSIKMIKVADPTNVYTVCGVDGQAGDQLGSGPMARFDKPHDVDFYDGALLVTDAGNGTIKRLVKVSDTEWQADGVVAGGASYPFGIGVTKKGLVIVADYTQGKAKLLR